MLLSSRSASTNVERFTQLRFAVAARRPLPPGRSPWRRRTRGFGSLPWLVGVLASVACDAQLEPGAACDSGQVACFGTNAELLCVESRFQAAPCNGPRGCTVSDYVLQCDFSGNAQGEDCFEKNDGQAMCSADGQQQIVCRDGHYRIEPCRGKTGCKSTGHSVSCDRSKAGIGDSCAGTLHACSVDSPSLLSCKDGTFQVESECPGPEGCSLDAQGIACDWGKHKMKRR